MAQLYLSGVPAADELISSDPLALLIGMVLDQQIPLEWAFEGPFNLSNRLDGKLDAGRLAEMALDDLVGAFLERPALHRYPASMAARVQALCRRIVTDYEGDPTRIWTTAETGAELLRRVQDLPGFGVQKAKIFVALLGKQLGVVPPGWVEASAPFGEEGSHLSVADIDSPDSLVLVREHKRAMKAAAKAARSSGDTPAKAPGRKRASTASGSKVKGAPVGIAGVGATGSRAKVGSATARSAPGRETAATKKRAKASSRTEVAPPT